MEILFDAATISRRVAELGRRISAAYQGRELALVGVLNGAFMLTADLARVLSLPALTVDFIRAASYGDAAESGGRVRLGELDFDPAGRHVLLVEDIVDSGHTMAHLREHLLAHQAASVAICALIDKKERREVEVVVEYPGFAVSNGFLVGYGLDYAQQHRHYPAIYRLDEETLS